MKASFLVFTVGMVTMVSVVLTVSRVCGPPRGLSWSGGGPEHRGARVVSGEPAPSLSRRTQHLHQIDTLDTLDM